MTFGVKRHLFGRFSWDSHFMIYMICNVCKRASSRDILEGRSWRARRNSLKTPILDEPDSWEIHGNTWTLWLYCIDLYSLCFVSVWSPYSLRDPVLSGRWVGKAHPEVAWWQLAKTHPSIWTSCSMVRHKNERSWRPQEALESYLFILLISICLTEGMQTCAMPWGGGEVPAICFKINASS